MKMDPFCGYNSCYSALYKILCVCGEICAHEALMLDKKALLAINVLISFKGVQWG